MVSSRFEMRRWVPWLVALAMLFGADTGLWTRVVSGGVGSAGAAPSASASKRKPAAKKQRAAGKKRKKAPRRRAYRAPEPVLPDDPAAPLGDSWQRHLDAFFKAARPAYGAFVALDARTGEILTVSERTSNRGRTPHPATTDRFPAASVFKMVTSAALLEGAHAQSGTQVCYHGGSSRLTMGNLTDSRRLDKRCRTLSGAFAHSTNSVFGKLAVRHLDGKGLVGMAEAFGFNRSVQVDGRTTRSKAVVPRDRLSLGRMAAGFTNATLSPLHGAAFAAMVANGGEWPEKIRIDGRAGGRAIDARTARALRSMMVQAACNGTGSRHVGSIRDPRGGGSVALKTGTLTSRDGSGLHNTWMVGFFPANKPRVAFAALVSLNGYGPLKAGHLARFALRTLLRLEKNRAGRS